MIRDFSEVPETIEGLRFYIDRAKKSIKDFQNKKNNLEKLLGIAQERLKNKEASPKIEEFE